MKVYEEIRKHQPKIITVNTSFPAFSSGCMWLRQMNWAKKATISFEPLPWIVRRTDISTCGKRQRIFIAVDGKNLPDDGNNANKMMELWLMTGQNGRSYKKSSKTTCIEHPCTRSKFMTLIIIAYVSSSCMCAVYCARPPTHWIRSGLDV